MPYRTQANDCVERLTRQLGNPLRLAQVEGKTIEDAVFSCFAKYCSMRHTTIVKLSAELMTGRQLQMPIYLVRRTIEQRR